jgi:neutral ceramidase
MDFTLISPHHRTPNPQEMTMGHRIPATASSLILMFLTAGALHSGDSSGLSAGCVKIDITPGRPVRLSGYENRKGFSTGVHDPLSARIVAFQAGGDKLVLVSTDVIGFYGGTAEAIRSAICSRCGLGRSQLFLAAIHTHSGPSLTLDADRGGTENAEYTRQVEEKLAASVGEALGHPSPVRIGMGTGSSPVGANRREVFYDDAGNPKMWIGRNPDGFQDRDVKIVKIASENGTPAAVLWEYATHSTSLGWDNTLISGDVHGLAEQFIERYFDSKVMAPGFAGASGDVDPWYRVLPGFETKNGWIPEPVLLGTLLGEEVVHVFRTTDCAVDSGPIRSAYETVELPGKPADSPTAPKDSPKTPITVTVGRVGPIAFVGIGAEVLSEIGREIEKASPFQHTIIITHCNGSAGYIAPRRLFLEGGYEVQTSPFASGAADLLIKRTVQMLHQLQ